MAVQPHRPTSGIVGRKCWHRISTLKSMLLLNIKIGGPAAHAPGSWLNVGCAETISAEHFSRVCNWNCFLWELILLLFCLSKVSCEV